MAHLFASTKEADCEIVFCAEARLAGAPASTPAKRPRQECSTGGHSRQQASTQHPAAEVFGQRLPAHRRVLSLASERFAAQLERWTAAGGHSKGRKRSASAARPCQLRIPLSSAAEVPAARAAIRFAYTGKVAASSSLREVLEIRRQAGYLQILGCVAACDKAMRAQLMGSNRAAKRKWRQAAFELYGCQTLWSGAEEEPSFAAVINAANDVLVDYFRDALRALNTPDLLARFTALPAVAVEGLLSCDQFGTDSESSVLLLLATWMKANYQDTDQQVRQRLCRTIRLAHLSRPYLSLVLPALAADHERDPDGPEGWFPLGVMEAAFVFNFAVASEEERRKLVDKMSVDTLWFHEALTAVPRWQCIPWDGLAYGWHIPQRRLKRALENLHDGGELQVDAVWDLGVPWVAADGFLWDLCILYRANATAAGVFVSCAIPSELPERVCLHGSPPGSTPVRIPVSRLVKVNKHAAGGGVVLRTVADEEGFFPCHESWGWPQCLPLRAQGQQHPVQPTQWPQEQPQQQPQPNEGGEGHQAPVPPVAELLSAWSNYLIDGKITGAFTLRPPP